MKKRRFDMGERETFTSLPEPTTLMENRMIVKMSLASTVRKAYEEITKRKLLTKAQIAENMGEKEVVIDAMLECIDLWSVDMLADFLWGLDLRIAGVMLAQNSDGEDDEDERIH